MALVDDVKVTSMRQHAKIAWTEIEPLFAQARQSTGSGDLEICQSLGYSGNVTLEWKRDGKAPLRAKYTLLGFLTELGVKAKTAKAPSRFTYEELSLIFAILNGIEVPNRRKLARKVAAEMMETE
jgi:hypothetical protein